MNKVTTEEEKEISEALKLMDRKLRRIRAIATNADVHLVELDDVEYALENLTEEFDGLGIYVD